MGINKEYIRTEEGVLTDVICPVIISASRVCDIPAFKSEWLIEQLKKSYTIWINPFNGKKHYVSFTKTRLIVFWTKNPAPLLGKLIDIDKFVNNYYFQYTLNDYTVEKIESGLPHLNFRIDTFKNLSETVGKNKVIWRFDPLILIGNQSVDNLISKIDYIGNQIYKFTNKLVISFADIEKYSRVKKRFEKNKIDNKKFSINNVLYLAKNLRKLNQKWNLDISTCAENIDLSEYNIYPNKCIDDELIKSIFSHDKELVSYVNKAKKDRGQRQFCSCIISKDIGIYRNCNYNCIYCYAS